MLETLKIQKLEKVGFVGQCMASPQSYKSSLNSGWSEPTSLRIAQYAIRQLEEARKKDIEAHERNLPLIEINKKIYALVNETMDAVGMPRQWSEVDRKSRARYPKRITHAAGFVGDLLRECPTSDGFEFQTSRYESMKADYERFLKEAETQDERDKKAEQEAQAKEEAKRRADMELASILLRYDLDVMSTWQDVLEALRNKDKYLDLAIAGLNVRLDWNDGPGEVSAALDSFSIESDQDKSISIDLLECLRDFEDGRVFRDTTWCYDSLFELVADKQLLADCKLAHERSRYD